MGDASRADVTGRRAVWLVGQFLWCVSHILPLAQPRLAQPSQPHACIEAPNSVAGMGAMCRMPTPMFVAAMSPWPMPVHLALGGTIRGGPLAIASTPVPGWYWFCRRFARQ